MAGDWSYCSPLIRMTAFHRHGYFQVLKIFTLKTFNSGLTRIRKIACFYLVSLEKESILLSSFFFCNYNSFQEQDYFNFLSIMFSIKNGILHYQDVFKKRIFQELNLITELFWFCIVCVSLTLTNRCFILMEENRPSYNMEYKIILGKVFHIDPMGVMSTWKAGKISPVQFSFRS